MSSWAFKESPWYGWTDIKSVVVSEGVTSIGDFAFLYCNRMEEASLPDGLESIGQGAFEYCTKLKTALIPDSVRTIGDFAFRDTEDLQTAAIPDGVKSIGIYTFLRCRNLKQVYIPESVTSIDDKAFTTSNPVVYGIEGSYAETYAAEKGLTFVSHDESSHTVDVWAVTKEATVFQKGVQEGKCTICNKTVAKDIPILKGTAPEITNVYNSSKGGDIRWKTVDGAAGYKVYRQRSSEGITLVAAIEDPSVTQCYDEGITDNCWGRVYHYYVTAVYKQNSRTKEGPKSEKLALQRLAPMVITEYELSGKKAIRLAWECSVKENKALGYEVQYATSSSDLKNRTGSFKKVTIEGRKNLSTTLKSLTGGNRYYIRVRCYVNYTNSVSGKTTKTWSQYSNTVKVKVP